MHVRLAASLVISSLDPNCAHGQRHCEAWVRWERAELSPR